MVVQKKQKRMVRAAVLFIPDVLPLIVSENVILRGEQKKAQIMGYRVNIHSNRLATFKTKGISCVSCGISAKFFALEKHRNTDDPYHLNLYALDDQGDDVLMTSDHIVPKSKGGCDCLVNRQTMCSPCNALKGDCFVYERTCTGNHQSAS